jgi:hypothetical protein
VAYPSAHPKDAEGQHQRPVTGGMRSRHEQEGNSQYLAGYALCQHSLLESAYAQSQPQTGNRVSDTRQAVQATTLK